MKKPRNHRSPPWVAIGCATARCAGSSLEPKASTARVDRIGNNDSAEWCQCENCVRLDPPLERQNGLASARYCTFVNEIVAKVYATHPTADLWAWGYQNYRLPPAGVALDKRLSVEACVHHRCYRHSVDDRILRLAFHTVGAIDVDDVSVVQEPSQDAAPLPAAGTR